MNEESVNFVIAWFDALLSKIVADDRQVCFAQFFPTRIGGQALEELSQTLQILRLQFGLLECHT